MKQRGRVSASKTLAVTKLGDRHPAPADMPPDQTAIWYEIINRMPSDYFAVQNLPLLAQYCRHTAQATRVAHMIEDHVNGEEFSPGQYDLLLKMLTRESASLCSLATKMRISQSALDDHKGQTKPNKTEARPIWES